jgi:quinol monooxygenase YgiN
VKTRTVSFFAGPDQVPEVRRRIEEEVLPRFRRMPGFIGFVALQSEGSRSEFVALSFWADGLEDSEAVSEEFRDEIERVTGAAPARQEFTIVKLSIGDEKGSFSLDLP